MLGAIKMYHDLSHVSMGYGGVILGIVENEEIDPAITFHDLLETGISGIPNVSLGEQFTEEELKQMKLPTKIVMSFSNVDSVNALRKNLDEIETILNKRVEAK
jgi:hypothetical protein